MEYKSNILESLQPDYIQLNSNVYADELTGNVSIGEVQGATFTNKFMVKSADDGINQIVLQHSGNGVAIAGIGQESSHGSLQLRLNSGATQVRLSAINSNYIIPNLGIGTTIPGAKLHIKEASGSTSQIRMSAESNEANYGYLTMLDNTVNTAKLTLGTTWGYNTPVDAMTIVNGTVGIGTDAPSAYYANANDLVVGTHTGSNGISILSATDQTGWLVFADSTAGGDNTRGAVAYNHDNNSMTLRVNNNPCLVITSVGDVEIKDALLSNQENTDIDTGAEVVAQVSTSLYTAAFFDFVIKKVGNIRSGTVYACHDGTNVEFTETSTQDLGDTSDVVLSVDISGANMRLLATVASDDWSVKSLIRAI